jgi:hypothetical protein
MPASGTLTRVVHVRSEGGKQMDIYVASVTGSFAGKRPPSHCCINQGPAENVCETLGGVGNELALS